MARDNRVFFGPRADAEPADSLPVLVPGRDPEPIACSHCGSADLEREPPLGHHRFGRLVCRTCSRELAWLDAPLAPVVRPVRGGSGEPSAVAATPPGRERIVITRIGRMPGCGHACSRLYGHDPAAHEAFGRALAYLEQQRSTEESVRTGRLEITRGGARVCVDGRETYVTPVEREILWALAARLGERMRHDEIVATVWGAATAALWGSKTYAGEHYWNGLRTPLSRLRARLGPAADLIETVTHYGYRLRAVPPGTEGS